MIYELFIFFLKLNFEIFIENVCLVLLYEVYIFL